MAASNRGRVWGSGVSSALELFDRLRVTDEAVAKVVRLSEISQIARAERRLRELYEVAWNRRAAEAIRAAGARAERGGTAKQITAIVDRIMGKWAEDVRARMEKIVSETYYLARTAGWKKATEQTRASLGYDVGHIVDVTKAKPRPGFSVDPSFNLTDQAAVSQLQAHQVFWNGKHYKQNVSDAIADTTRTALVTAGNDLKKAGKEIRRALETQLGKVVVPKGFNGSAAKYFEGLAANAATVSRAFGQMESFRQAGAREYKIVNPIDERTCPVCGHMNGKTFTVSSGVSLMENVLAADSPEGVKKAQPWIRRKQLLQLSPKAGPAGASDSSKLAEAGFISPPFHYRCRCSVDINITAGFTDLIPPEPVVKPTAKPKPKPTAKPKPKPKTPPPPAAEVPGPAVDPQDFIPDEVEGIHGKPYSGDGGYIDNQTINVRRYYLDGDWQYEFQFKIHEEHEDHLERFWKVFKKDKDFKEANKWLYEPKRMSRGHLAEVDKVGVLPEQIDGKIGIRYRKAAGDAPVTELRVGNEARALKGQVRLLVQTDDPAVAFRELEKVADEMQIPHILRAPSAARQEIEIKRRILRQFAPKESVIWDFEKATGRARGAPSLVVKGAKRLPDSEVAKRFEKLRKENPAVGKVLQDAKTREITYGHTTTYSKAQAEIFKDVPGLYHDSRLSSQDLADILGAKKSSLMSSASRFEKGVFKTGTSTKEDFGTGGARSLFMRVSRDEYTIKYADPKWDVPGRVKKVRFVSKGKPLGRQDWYAYNGDEYGSTELIDIRERIGVGKIAKDFDRMHIANEVMFPHGVDLDDFEYVMVASKQMRDDVIAELKDWGVKKIGKKDIEDFVRFERSAFHR